MKNLIILISIILLSSCADNQPQEKNTLQQGNKYSVNNNVEMTKLVIDDIEYHVYETGSGYTGIHVINHTKELLEVEKLRKELGKDSNEYKVTATMYYPVESQCDSDPLTTAGMYHINPSKASEHKWIAMSRDMLTRWGGDFDYGDKVEISGTGEKDGIYTVVDTMNERFTNKIDILETKGTPLYKYDDVTLKKVT